MVSVRFNEPEKKKSTYGQILTERNFPANGNDFEGMIPDLSNLQNISEIDLSVNGLSGPFPTEVLDLPLIFLDIRFNVSILQTCHGSRRGNGTTDLMFDK